MTARDAILSAIPEAGGSLQREGVRTPALNSGLWVHFQSKLEALGGRVVAEISLPTDSVWVEEAASALLGEESTAASIWDAQLGVCVAELAVAEMGSVLVCSGNGRERLSSLIPPINLILVPRDRIVGTLAEAIENLPDRNCALITGPSRTADIEGVLVKGVHGPKEVWVHPYG